MKKVFICFSLAVSAVGFGQKKPVKTNLISYSYQTFNCENKGFFDPKKYKQEEIDGVYNLLYKYNGIYFDSHPVFKLSDLDDIRKNKNLYLQQLEKQYQERKKELYALQVINQPVWKKLHQENILIFENEYQLQKETIIAFSDPSSLKNSQFYSTCKEYIDAVASSDTKKRDAVWKNFIEIRSKNNADPQGVMANFKNKLSDPKKEDYALIDLIGFGFYNCANGHFRQPSDEDGTIYTSFDNLFTKLKKDCDEP